MDVLNWISANFFEALILGTLVSMTLVGIAHGLGPKAPRP